MSEIQLKSIVDYLRRTGSTVHKKHLTAIRDCYRQVLQLSTDIALPEDPNEEAITEVALLLSLCIDTDEARNYLCECVRYPDIDDAEVVVSGKLAGEEKPMDELIFKTDASPASPSLTRLTPSIIQNSPNVTEDSTLVTDIDCLLNIKRSTTEVDQFIHSFLLQNTKASHQQVTTNSTSMSIRYNEQFYLVNGCLLDLFIRKQLCDRGIITSINRRTSAHFRLIEPISLTDDFGTWEYDHLRDLIDLELSPHGNNARFPARWRLADDARIYCRMDNHDSAKRMPSSSNEDRPRTASLDVFVHDVCAHENNDQGNAWLDALHKENIFRYEHLDNLRQSEWDNIQKLPMNARKILKAAVDRERANVAGARHQRITYDSDQEDDDNTMHNNTKELSYSRSELLADLHLIKLFIYYTLREEQALRRRGALPKLEGACLDMVFNEMREEGFADDGLFPKMAESFLPLTISEQELCIERELDKQKRQTLVEHREQLIVNMKKTRADNVEHTEIYWTYDENITTFKARLNKARDSYLQERSIIAARTSDGQQQQAQALQKLDQQWHRHERDLMRKITEEEKLKNDLVKVTNKLTKEIDEIEARLQNIEIELAVPPKYVDKQLIKPARGLIMYGPPGTGKSDIMKKLAAKLGIAMVGPPLAAGELNRPLVGESERILIALCQRCNRIPYAMCCLSIDEIDSLAPKRDEDSSEGKVDKISVLLSLIEGIKDVPNLMLLCATNRLHMMDEAFLRRMSDKFFVGRPSSNARTTILKHIPDCALEPEILDRLSIATTNFSGAAVRALTRMITVKCITARRSTRNYKIDYAEALKIADRAAQQYQILFGSETLPRLLLRNLHNDSRLRVHHLSNHSNYTGRIIVDLHSGHVRIETHVQRIDTTSKSLSIIEHELHSSETNVQSLLERLTIYGKNRNVQLLQLVDLNLLASQGAHDEKKVFETLKDRYDECVAYTRSMIVYDLDALVGVNKSESESNMGLSTSSSVVNQRIYTYVRARFRDSAIEDEQNQSTDRIERWVVAIIREPFLLRQFCTDVQFTLTPREENELELERRKAKDLLKCVKCKDFYIENENKMGNCVHHDGFVYDNSAADMTIFKSSEAIMELNKLECELINDAERRDELERKKNKFKWICCDAVLVSGNVGGCKKGKHGFNVIDIDQQRLADTIIDRLDQATLQQWEEACRTNEEYNDRWLMLLEKRG